MRPSLKRGLSNVNRRLLTSNLCCLGRLFEDWFVMHVDVFQCMVLSMCFVFSLQGLLSSIQNVFFFIFTFHFMYGQCVKLLIPLV